MTTTLLMLLLLESAARSLALGLIAAIALWALRVRTAQVRHLVWSAVLAGSLCMPFLPSILRSLTPDEPAVAQFTAVRLPAPPTLAMPVSPTASEDVKTPPKRIEPEQTAVAAYLLIAGFLLARFATGLYLTWRIAQRSDTTSGNIRISQELRAPVTFGRTILLPGNANHWSEETLSAVLRHEESHCERGDFFTQAASRLHRVVFWFNPMAWWLDRELSDLAEQACDDAAVTSKADCPGYAELLLAFAGKSRLSTEAAVAMARLSSVSRRVERLLDAAFEPGPRKLTLASKARVLAGVIPLVLLASIYTVTLDAQQPPKPPVPPKPPSHGTSFRNHRESSFILVEGEHRTIMSGDSDDLNHARDLKAKPPYAWFRQDGKEYLIDDPAAIKRIQELFRPQEELGRLQEKLGEEQSKLGEQQAELGEKQARIHVDVPDLSKEMRMLADKISALHKKQAELEELADLQGRLGDLQGRLGELQGLAGGKQAELGRLQAELGAKQGQLGQRQGELGERQARAAEKAQAELEREMERWVREGKAKPIR